MQKMKGNYEELEVNSPLSVESEQDGSECDEFQGRRSAYSSNNGDFECANSPASCCWQPPAGAAASHQSSTSEIASNHVLPATTTTTRQQPKPRQHLSFAIDKLLN